MEREKGEFGTMAFIKIDELTKDNGNVVLWIHSLISQSNPKYPKGRTGTANSLLLIQVRI